MKHLKSVISIQFRESEITQWSESESEINNRQS